MSKGKSFISEIGKYFKENDATSAMNHIIPQFGIRNSS